jgi:hypothetical protein
LVLVALVAQLEQAVTEQHPYFLQFQPLAAQVAMGHKTAAHPEIVLRVELVLLASATTQMAVVEAGRLRLEQTAPI